MKFTEEMSLNANDRFRQERVQQLEEGMAKLQEYVLNQHHQRSNGTRKENPQ